MKYYLLEDDGWSIDLKSLREAIETHRKTAKSTIRALILVNPGNPSGSVFSRETLRAAIDICDEYGISIMSDEVYQLNTYAEAPGKQRPVFHSMKRCSASGKRIKEERDLLSSASIRSQRDSLVSVGFEEGTWSATMFRKRSQRKSISALACVSAATQ